MGLPKEGLPHEDLGSSLYHSMLVRETPGDKFEHFPVTTPMGECSITLKEKRDHCQQFCTILSLCVHGVDMCKSHPSSGCVVVVVVVVVVVIWEIYCLVCC